MAFISILRSCPGLLFACLCLVVVAPAAAIAQSRTPTPSSAPTPALPAPRSPDAPPVPAPMQCTVDLALTGTMCDIVSNVLTRNLRIPAARVRPFLREAKTKYATGPEVIPAAARHFEIDEAKLTQLVETWRHVNCKHAAVPGYVAPDAAIDAASGPALAPVPVSAFAGNVTLHVVLHELGHAVIREFDILVLGNEETMADAFATHFLIEHLPERAYDAIKDRVTSLRIEADEVPRDQWTVRGEHDNDARRAFQIVALAVAADAEKYAGLAESMGMSDREIASARDYGADIHRAWRRTLAPILMPPGRRSREARLRADEATSAFVDAGSPSLQSAIESAITRIDWHSQVTVDFVSGEGGAAWNRNKRTITVNGEYLRRFIAQGVKAEAAAATKK